MDKDRLYRLQLACIAEVMPQAVRSLRREFGSADRICDLGADEIDALVYLKDEEKAELKSGADCQWRWPDIWRNTAYGWYALMKKGIRIK